MTIIYACSPVAINSCNTSRSNTSIDELLANFALVTNCNQAAEQTRRQRIAQRERTERCAATDVERRPQSRRSREPRQGSSIGTARAARPGRRRAAAQAGGDRRRRFQPEEGTAD